jgi:hypothetical protein
MLPLAFSITFTPRYARSFVFNNALNVVLSLTHSTTFIPRYARSFTFPIFLLTYPDAPA